MLSVLIGRIYYRLFKTRMLYVCRSLFHSCYPKTFDACLNKIIDVDKVINGVSAKALDKYSSKSGGHIVP